MGDIAFVILVIALIFGDEILDLFKMGKNHKITKLEEEIQDLKVRIAVLEKTDGSHSSEK